MEPTSAFERALQVVDQRQQLGQQIRRRRFGHLLALPLDALAIVVELGGLAQQPLVVVVALPLQLARVRSGLYRRCVTGLDGV